MSIGATYIMRSDHFRFAFWRLEQESDTHSTLPGRQTTGSLLQLIGVQVMRLANCCRLVCSPPRLPASSLGSILLFLVSVVVFGPNSVSACLVCQNKCPQLSPFLTSTISLGANLDQLLTLVDPRESYLVKDIVESNGSHWNPSDSRLQPCTHILIALLLDELKVGLDPASGNPQRIHLSPIPRPHLHPWWNSNKHYYNNSSELLPSDSDNDPLDWEVDSKTEPSDRLSEKWKSVEVRNPPFQTKCTRHKEVHNLGVDAHQMDLLEYLVEDNSASISLESNSQAYLKFGNIYVGIYLRQGPGSQYTSEIPVSYLEQFVDEARQACWTPSTSSTSSLDMDEVDEGERFVVSVAKHSMLVYFVDYYHRDILPL